jgi:5'-nucleotidase
VPAIPESEIRGIRLTRQGSSTWDDTFDVRLDPANREYYWLKGRLNVTDTDPEADQIAVQEGYVSVTPIHYDLTDRKLLSEMENWGVERLR